MATPRTGRPRGRPKNARNKRTAETVAKAAQLGMLPHEFLCAVAQGRKIGDHVPTFAERMVAARDAAPYYAPKLAATEVSGPDGGPIQHRISSAQAELEGKLARLAERLGKN